MTEVKYPSEPPDGTRIEFEVFTDVYAAWRDDACSIEAGWQGGDGGEVWLEYGSTVPKTWHELIWAYSSGGHSLAEACEAFNLAVRLLVHPDDEAKRRQWPTQKNKVCGPAIDPV